MARMCTAMLMLLTAPSPPPPHAHTCNDVKVCFQYLHTSLMLMISVA